MCVCQNCNVCKYSVCERVVGEEDYVPTQHGVSSQYRYNLYCSAQGNNIAVDFSVPENARVEVPAWCPLKDEVVNDDKPLTFSEKIKELNKFKPQIEWDDIKENTVYHIPQVTGEERKDIFIIHKSNYSCTYRVLSQPQSNIIYTLYPSMMISKFLVEHKIQQIVIGKQAR